MHALKHYFQAVLLTLSTACVHADDLSALVERYVTWRGGAAYEHLQSIHYRGTLDTAGLHGTEGFSVDRSGRQRIDSDLGVIKQVQVITPEQSWEITPSGQVQTMAQSDEKSLRRDAALQFPDVLRGLAGAKAVLHGSEIRDGRSWAVVRVTFDDADVYDAFIDPQSGALAGYRILEDRQTRFEGLDDWRMVDGVRMPFLQATKTEAPGGDQTVEVQDMELNAAIAATQLARPSPVRKTAFKNNASSTGWIKFERAGNRIFFPAKINGHDTVVLLDSGATVSGIDKSFAAAIGLKSKGSLAAPGTGGIDTMGFIDGVDVQVGDLILRNISVAAIDLASVAKHIGHALPFVLGDEVFNELAVDIDFAHHRLALRDPAAIAKPDGAAEVPLIRAFGNRSVPVSVDGEAPVQFEFDLGNGSPMQIYPAYYQKHPLLEGHRTSQVMFGGVGGFHPWTVASLSQITFAGVDFSQVPADFAPDTLSGANSNVVVGNIGLPILARFRLIIDYSHDRLYAAPYADAASTAFDKDRVGMTVIKENADLVVEFVSPGSPAEAAGFKIGDRIAMIDRKPAAAWTESSLDTLRYASAGTVLSIILKEGNVRKIKSADFF
jgi:Aspartyl protease/PDZ domain